MSSGIQTAKDVFILYILLTHKKLENNLKHTKLEPQNIDLDDWAPHPISHEELECLEAYVLYRRINSSFPFLVHLWGKDKRTVAHSSETTTIWGWPLFDTRLTRYHPGRLLMAH